MKRNEPGGLRLHEAVLLLALRDDTGRAIGGWWKHALGGAIIAELLGAGRIEIESGKKSFVNVLDGRKTGDPAMDSCLERIRSAKRRAQAPVWIGRFANMPDLKHDVARSLCAKGVLMEDEAKVLIFFKQKVYPEINPKPERDLIRAINDAGLNQSGEPSSWTKQLIAVAQAGEQLKALMDKHNWKRAKTRFEAIMKADRVGSLTKEAVSAAQSAAAAAVVVTTG